MDHRKKTQGSSGFSLEFLAILRLGKGKHYGTLWQDWNRQTKLLVVWLVISMKSSINLKNTRVDKERKIKWLISYVLWKINRLFDLGCRGNRFTWSNKHSDDTFTKERLDMVVANNPWWDFFKEAWVEGLIVELRPQANFVNHDYSTTKV